jgi:hypothetical protein
LSAAFSSGSDFESVAGAIPLDWPKRSPKLSRRREAGNHVLDFRTVKYPADSIVEPLRFTERRIFKLPPEPVRVVLVSAAAIPCADLRLNYSTVDAQMDVQLSELVAVTNQCSTGPAGSLTANSDIAKCCLNLTRPIYTRGVPGWHAHESTDRSRPVLDAARS